MSQHFLDPRNPQQVRYIMVGWDRPMGAFFADVVSTAGADGEDVFLTQVDLWDGVTDPQVIIDAVAPYAEIPADLLSTLAAEREESPFATIEQHNRVSVW